MYVAISLDVMSPENRMRITLITKSGKIIYSLIINLKYRLVYFIAQYNVNVPK